jgi:hypothetical protein
LALAIATAVSLATAAVVVPRVDDGPGSPSVDAPAEGQASQEPTEYQREEAARTARKLGQIAGWASAALLPSALAVAAAGLLVVGFRVAGARPSYRPALAVAAHGMLPVWLRGLLRVPAAVAHAPVPREEVPNLLPSSLAALLPSQAPPAWLAFLSGLDLFALWAAVLVALGMARVSGTSRARSAVTTAVLFLAYVALVRVVPVGRGAGGAL